MSSPGDVTLQSYEAAAERYRAASPPTAPQERALLDELAQLIPGGTLLEVGSGPGDDASYLENKGVLVLRSDGAQSFVDMMRAGGYPARLLDVRSDDLGGPYDAILAIAVLVHLSRDEFESFLVRARDAVPGGYLAFTLKEGDGDAWSTAKLDLPRHFTVLAGESTPNSHGSERMGSTFDHPFPRKSRTMARRSRRTIER